MEKDNKNIIIILLLVIIAILAALCALTATNRISFNNSNDTNNSTNDDNTNQQTIETSSVIGNYQEIINYAQNAFTIYEFKLNSDNTLEYVIGYSNNSNYSDAKITMKYMGTYLEKDNKIVLSIISSDNNCENNDKYPCKDIITLTKQNDNKLIGTDKYTYDKVNNLILIK